MLHEASNGEPETVAKRVLIDQQVTATFKTGVGVVPLIRCQSGENETMELDNRESRRKNRANKSGNESWIEYSDESKTQGTGSKRNGERKGDIDKEQNNSNSQLSTKSPWLSRERTNLLFIPHVLPT